MIANSTSAGFWNPIANTAANQAINTMRDFFLKRLSAGGRKYDDVTQVSKPAVSPTSSRQTVLCSGACGFGNPRDSRFGNLRYRIRHRICAPEHLTQILCARGDADHFSATLAGSFLSGRIGFFTNLTDRMKSSG